MNSPLFRLARSAPPRRLASLTGYTVLGAMCEGAGFAMLGPLLARLDTASAPSWLPASSLESLLLAFVALVVLRSAAELRRVLAAQALRAGLVDGLRNRAVAALVAAEWRVLGEMDQSANRALLISSLDRADHAVSLFASLLRLAILITALGIAAFSIAPWAALGLLAAGWLGLLALSPLRARARRDGTALTGHYEQVHQSLEHVLGGLRPIKSFARQTASREILARRFAALRGTERQFLRDGALAQGALQLGGAIVLCGTIWLAAGSGKLPLATLLPLVALGVRAVPLLLQVQSLLQDWHHAAPALEEAQALIDRAEAAAEPAPAPDAPRLRDRLVLSGVSVSLGRDQPALAPIDLTLAAGTMLAITGPSGSGKSTLADVIGGLLAPDTGTLSVDGIVLDGPLRTAWRSRTAYVQQEPVLFSGSIRDNLLWAEPDASEAEIHSALARAGADFVARLPESVDSDIGALGKALSGGERQRIALARALLRQPDLLILDEAASALDEDSERVICDAVRGLTPECTVLIIAHRGVLAQAADRVIALAPPS